MRSRLVLFAVAALALPVRARAQDAAALQRLADSLARVVVDARARLAAFDDSVRADMTATTVVDGGMLRLAAEPPLLPMARRAVPAILDTLRRALGPSLPRLQRFTFEVRQRVPERWKRPDGAPELDLRVVWPDGSARRGWRSAAWDDALRDLVVASAIRSVFEEADRELLRWMGNVIPRDPLTPEEWARQRMALLSSRAAAGPRCHRGDRDACKVVLGLVPVTDPAIQWHDAASRLRLVRDRSSLARRIDGAMAQACERGSDSACIVLLRQFPVAALGDPGSVGTRVSVAREAVAAGGEGALARLLEASGPPAEQLAVAAGIPVDSLVARWQARVRDTQAPSRDLSREIALVAMAWATGLGLLSLRSSRWR